MDNLIYVVGTALISNGKVWVSISTTMSKNSK